MQESTPMKNSHSTFLLVCLCCGSIGFGMRPAFAYDDASRHGEHVRSAAPQPDSYGQPGSANKATRTVAITTSDAMRFDPGSLTFKQGETVRLRITNIGKLPHEFVLGTAREIAEHAERMRSMPGMMHVEANAVRVAPGKTEVLVWKFSASGRFSYACLIPGHREAGMQGTITVAAQSGH
jgi:uncharacterized cupredoxin-like copper-binding protein